MQLRLPDRGAVDYQVARSNTKWPDHMLRTQLTAGLISWFHPESIFDPACGDASIVMAAHQARSISVAYLSDVSEPSIGELRRTRKSIPEWLPPTTILTVAPLLETLRIDEYFDLVVLTEILEHVEDPAEILRLARRRSRVLVASSPRMVPGGRVDDNPEHLWQFDEGGYRELLEKSGWVPTCMVLQTMENGWYDFQIWGAT